MPDLDTALQTLNDVFGFPRFRDGQGRVISRLLDGRSTLAIFPTGGGKSLCYQLPALLHDGLTVVVSPLIALMKDQVDFLVSRGIPAARLDSSLEPEQTRQVHADLRGGRLKILYVAPERLVGERFLHTLAGRRIALLAIDEAHCISEWGHNFRPEYLKLARVATRLEVGCVLALTATATPEVARDVAAAFGIDADGVIVTPFHRANLELHATPCRADERRGRLVRSLRARPRGPTIVYVTLQKTAESLAEFLAGEGFKADAYHAGLKDDERNRVQDAFMASRDMIVVATIAFGMGIDKSDIRSVYHYNLPKSLESYTQEIGRAGRDGQPASCELFACIDDVVTLENFTYGDTPTPEAIASFLGDLLGQGDEFDVSVHALSQSHDIRPMVVQTLLTYLELEGVVLATGPFHGEYKIQPLRPVEAIVGRFDAPRAEFLRRLFAHARRGRTWFTLDLATAARQLGEGSGRIIKAIHYLEEQGDVVLQVSDVRNGFRRVRDDPDLDRLEGLMVERFERREAREVARVRRMLDFAQAEGCLTRRLLAYFGEDLPADCGHCGRCLGVGPTRLPDLPHWSPDRSDREMLASLQSDRPPALKTPRQVARFLCGLSSPATTRARLTRDARFGRLAHVPFSRVREFAGGAASN
jgi:ATP-dependent DNA helicase RecQ